MQLEKVYEPQRFEPHWAQFWIDRGFFHAPSETDPARGIFSLVIPPPNVTGSLHIGHMLEHTEIDVTNRWHRMRGDQTLWQPGTDHAGIATQMVVERNLKETENITRHDLGREEFERRVWQWKEQYGGRILSQMKRIGDSCDWSRNRFTLDEGLSRAVRETFVRLYEKGLIYRGEYMVNWCPRCHTALSDLEVVHDDTDGNLWHIRYPVTGVDGRFLTVATTRPETMLGDTAVAINPKDERYADLHGRSVILPLMNREIPIILDELADPEFGTGVVKVTPAHDPNDFEAGKRHNLPHVVVIGLTAEMTEAAGDYAGLDRFEARKRVLSDLDDLGLLEKTAPHKLSVGKCQRCKTVVEPLVSKQWFCKMKPLAEPAIQAVEDGRIKFVPENWTKTYNEWMYNIRDWCVSRQLWWGHRIPAWHCEACGEPTVARVDPTECAHCHSKFIRQDPDVLDTWFSSGLWPFSTLGWPDQTSELKAYYPTTLLITGFDILFFWVARMIMLGMELMGDVPFRTVYIHGLVRDAERQKMSKTKGNTIDPLIVTEQYGTDAVRFSLLRGAAPGTDIVLSEERMVSSRAFANKIWNAARFIFMQMEKVGVDSLDLDAIHAPIAPPAAAGLPAHENERKSPRHAGSSGTANEESGSQAIVRGSGVAIEDRWIFHRLNDITARINAAQENYRYHEVADLIWGFLWDEFCDWYVEIKKLRINTALDAGDSAAAAAHLNNMLRVFETALRLLHPVMPFLTEELWQRLVKKVPGIPPSICLAAFPQASLVAENESAAADFALLQEMITRARALRADNKIDPNVKVEGYVETSSERAASVAMSGNAILNALAGGRFEINPSSKAAGSSSASVEFAVTLTLSGTQVEAIRQRVSKRIGELEKVIANSTKQLSSEAFVSKAPAHVIDGIKEKLGQYETELVQQKAALAELA
ncbi:MAG TPA: valine--tRNA ligase [Bryobacteraceae bacterium]|nr:valine--tRNA ligase [Bryobacteraceae bacterium]